MSWAITATMAAVMGTTTAMSIRAQNEAAQQQQESIAATTRMNYMLKQQQEQELKEKTGMELTQKSIEAFAQRGKVKAAQAESGVAGASPLREFANTYLQESLTKGSIVSQGEAGQRTLALENQSTYLQGLSEINKLESQKTTGGAALLQVGLAAGAGALMGGAMAGAGTSIAAGGSIPAGTAGTLTSTAAGSSMSIPVAASSSSMVVPAGMTFTSTGGLFTGLSATSQMTLGSTLYGASQSKY